MHCAFNVHKIGAGSFTKLVTYCVDNIRTGNLT